MKILFSGYYGFGNLGDEALLEGLLHALEPRFGGALCVLSQRPSETAALHGVAACHRIFGLPALLRPSALVSGGGGLLQDKTSARSLRYYLGVIALAKRLGRSVVVYGQSLGPLSAEGERAIARVLRGVPIAVRDETSRRLLERLELPATLVADPALLLPKVTAHIDAASPVVLIPRGGYPEITKTLGALALRLDTEGIPLAGLALHPQEDAAALAALRAQVPRVQLLSAATPLEALEHLARSRHVVSARLHGLILAARVRRPFSALAYDPKVTAFMQEAGGQAHPLTVDAHTLWTEIERAALDITALERLEARARNGVAWLGAQLAANAAS